jgi:hypothetical protein
MTTTPRSQGPGHSRPFTGPERQGRYRTAHALRSIDLSTSTLAMLRRLRALTGLNNDELLSRGLLLLTEHLGHPSSVPAATAASDASADVPGAERPKGKSAAQTSRRAGAKLGEEPTSKSRAKTSPGDVPGALGGAPPGGTTVRTAKRATAEVTKEPTSQPKPVTSPGDDPGTITGAQPGGAAVLHSGRRRQLPKSFVMAKAPEQSDFNTLLGTPPPRPRSGADDAGDTAGREATVRTSKPQ